MRAVLEGVAYGLRDSLDLVARAAAVPALGRVSGGGARSDLWLRIIASVLELPLQRMEVDEGAAFGAALLGGVARRPLEQRERHGARRRTGVVEQGCPSSGPLTRTSRSPPCGERAVRAVGGVGHGATLAPPSGSTDAAGVHQAVVRQGVTGRRRIVLG